MKAKELVQFIQENNLGEYEVYAGGETGGTCWEINPQISRVEEKGSNVYHGMYYVTKSIKPNALVL